MTKKYDIKKKNIVGHSYKATNTKKDPGEKLTYKKLAIKTLCKLHTLNEKKIKKYRNLKVKNNEKDKFLRNLYKIGYSKINKNNKVNLIKAFQRKYRQNLINGKLDQETYLISKNVLNIK